MCFAVTGQGTKLPKENKNKTKTKQNVEKRLLLNCKVECNFLLFRTTLPC